MPDVHPKKSEQLVLLMTVGDSILPSLVGVDIGCGMTIAKIKTKGLEFQQLDTVIRENVPVGCRIREKAHKYADKIDLGELKCSGHSLRKQTSWNGGCGVLFKNRTERITDEKTGLRAL